VIDVQLSNPLAASKISIKRSVAVLFALVDVPAAKTSLEPAVAVLHNILYEGDVQVGFSFYLR
jgi:hypothetical protein